MVAQHDPIQISIGLPSTGLMRSYRGITEYPCILVPQHSSVYRLNFGRHYGKTIEEVLSEEPGYVIGYILETPDLLEERPDLFAALGKISEEEIQQNRFLRRALEKNRIIEARARGPILKSIGDEYSTWETADLSVVRRLESHAPSQVFDETPFTNNRPTAAPIFVSFTGTVLKAKRYSPPADVFNEQASDTLDVMPCGWRIKLREEEITGDITPANPDDLGEMVNQTYRFYAILPLQKSPLRFQLCRSPEPSPLQKGICFRIKGTVISVVKNDVRIKLEWKDLVKFGDKTFLNVRYTKRWEIDVYLEDGVEQPHVGGIYYFRGVLAPSRGKVSAAVITVQSIEEVNAEVYPEIDLDC